MTPSKTLIWLFALVILALSAACSSGLPETETAATPAAALAQTATPGVLENSPVPASTVTAAPGEPENSQTPEPDHTPTTTAGEQPAFDGERALTDVETQVAFGPRLPGSEAHARAVEWMVNGLEEAGWETEIQETTMMDQPVRNVIARRGEGQNWIILGAHYDSRFWADNDPDPANHQEPVPGANDGASGVAVLMEMARTLPADLDQEIWLVFFDAEDQGRIPGWDWILGSRAFAESLTSQPDAVIVVDMIGDADLNIYREHNSDSELMDEIWAKAAELGYGEQFIPEYKYTILDDHIPFVERGIRAADLIDFDYPYWHTLEDTTDKVSAESLQAVGDTLTAWILDR